MIYKVKSAKYILTKVYRDYKPTANGWESSAIEWIGEALEAIGASAGLVTKSTTNEGCDGAVTVENHRAKLPCDLVNLLAVEYNGRNLPYGGDVTGAGLSIASRTTDIYSNNGTSATTEILPGNSIPLQNVNTVSWEQTVTDYYLINPNYIQTSFETGHLKLHYEAYPVCSEGYPLVPDHYYYDTALSWYVVSKLILSGGYTNADITFQFAHQMWCEYKLLASNKAMYPSIGKMHRFMNMWVRLVPNTSLPDDFFAGGETQESIKRV
jgi:hypothetical protein